MHWLSDRIGSLQELLERQKDYEQMVEAKVTGAEDARKKARDDFLKALRELVESIASRKGVRAAFSCHDGLLIESAGISDNFEALAAVSQNLLYSGLSAMKSLKFGKLSQMVLVGDSMKLAFFVMGEIEIGITASTDINLTELLSQKPFNNNDKKGIRNKQ